MFGGEIYGNGGCDERVWCVALINAFVDGGMPCPAWWHDNIVAPSGGIHHYSWKLMPVSVSVTEVTPVRGCSAKRRRQTMPVGDGILMAGVALFIYC